MSEQLISCNLIGGLGNQLFQIAATLGYAYANNWTPLFEKITESPSVIQPRPTYWNSYLHNLTAIPKSKLSHFKTFDEKEYTYTPLPTFKENTLLNGYFQSEKYFKEYKHGVLAQLSLHPTRIQSIQNEYANALKIPNKLAIHIRRGDYLKLNKQHTVLSKTNYYKKAITYFPDIKDILIFSDDINWCKNHIKKLLCPSPKKFFPRLVDAHHKNKTFHFLESDDVTELYLMSQCQHHIIANSSFSWWGAYMSQSNGNVVAPKQWFGKKLKHNTTKDLYLDSWIIV